jgi:hypothetical protein
MGTKHLSMEIEKIVLPTKKNYKFSCEQDQLGQRMHAS